MTAAVETSTQPAATQTVAEQVNTFLATTLTFPQDPDTGAVYIDGKFYRMKTRILNGSLCCRITQINFDRPDCIVELLLHPTPPVHIDPEPPVPEPLPVLTAARLAGTDPLTGPAA